MALKVTFFSFNLPWARTLTTKSLLSPGVRRFRLVGPIITKEGDYESDRCVRVDRRNTGCLKGHPPGVVLLVLNPCLTRPTAADMSQAEAANECSTMWEEVEKHARTCHMP